MSMSVGELMARLGLDDSNFQSGLNRAKQQAEGVTGSMKSSFGGFAGFAQNALSTAAGFIGANVLGGIASGVQNVARAMISGNSQFETYQTQFGVLLGSSDKAKDRLADLAQFGANTPFELPQVVEADKILQGFGLHAEDTAAKFGFSGEQIRTIAGDVASGTGAGFSEMTLLLGKFSQGATGEAISRMAELGITSRAELAGLGLEFSKSGELLSPLPDAMSVVLKLMQDKYGGMMDAQSKTFDGMMSNLQDWIGGTLRQLGQPIFEVVKDKLQVLLTFLGSPETKATLESFAQMLAVGIGTAMTFLTTVAIPALIAGWNAVSPVLNTVAAFVSGNLQPILAGLAAALVTIVVPAFIAWSGTALAAAGATIVALAPVIAPIVAIGAAVALLKMAWDSDWMGIRTTLTAFWNSTGQPIFNTLKSWLETNLPVAIQTLTNFWNTQLQPALRQVWGFIQGSVIPILIALADVHLALVQRAVQELANLWQTRLQPALSVVWSFIQTSVVPILRSLADVINSTVGPAMNAVIGWISTATGGFDNIKGAISGVIGFLRDMAAAIRSLPSVPGVGGGVPHYASGTNFHPGGLALVGEEGPELVNLPRGASVATASETSKMLGGGGNTNVFFPNATFINADVNEDSLMQRTRMLTMVGGL